MNRMPLLLVLAGAAAIGLAVVAVAAGDPDVRWHVIGGGGGRSSSSSYVLHGTMGQPAVQVSSGPGHRVSGGFWQPWPAASPAPGGTASATAPVTPGASATQTATRTGTTVPSPATGTPSATPGATDAASATPSSTPDTGASEPVYLPATRKRA